MSNIIQLETRSPNSPEELIETAKKIAGVTQRELASQISASRDQIYRWKKGMVDMPDDKRNKLTDIISKHTSDTPQATSEPADGTSIEGRPRSPKAAAWEAFYDTHKSEGQDLTVLPFLEMAFEFGFQFPGHVDQAGRTTQSQVEQVIKEHGKSHAILTNWIETFIDTVDTAEKSENTSLITRFNLHKLAMAKMDLSPIFKQTLDKDKFSVQAYAVTMEAENEIKNFLKEYLDGGGVIYRNFFRLATATNDSLLTECELYEERSGDITQYYSLADRMIIRELKSLKNMISR